MVWTPLNLRRIKEWIKAGRLETDGVITMKHMRDCGLIRRRVGDGVKLLAIVGFFPYPALTLAPIALLQTIFKLLIHLMLHTSGMVAMLCSPMVS